MRNLSAEALAKLATRLGTEPVTIIEIDWVEDGGASLYADRDVQSIRGKILEVGDLDNIINVTNSDNSQELEVTLDDTDGTIKAILDQHDIHKRSARVYQWFEGLGLEDRFMLFSGKISSPIRWGERDRAVSFTIISQLEDKEIGFSAEEGDFQWIPKDLIGKTWPMIFGKVADVPALQFNKAVTGTTMCGVGIVSGSTYHNAMPLGGDDQALYVSAAAMQAQINHLNRVQSAYDQAYSQSRYEDYNNKADQCRDQANSIRRQLSEMFGKKAAQEACAQQQRQETVTNKGLGCNPVRILGGEDFPQNTGLVLNINGGLFSGHFFGDQFHISSRVHAENEQAAQKAYQNGVASQVCAQDPPHADWDYQTNVPPGFGGAYVESGYSYVWVNDLIRTHGFAFGTQQPTFRPSTSQVARHFWAEAGSRVTIASDEPITYVVSIVPGTVLAVKAYKNFDNERKLVNVPNDLWHVETKNYGPITAVQVVTSKPLDTIEGQGWEDDLYVTFQSNVGPHIIDILQYIINNYTDLAYDEGSFTAVRPKLDAFPANFPILSRKNTLDVLQEIAFQARCALWISNGKFYIKYLPEEPANDDSITITDIDAETGVEVELTSTEDLVTKMVVNWRISYAEEESNKLILRHNVAKYGTQEEEYDFYVYNQPDIVLKVATFWLIRKSNTWKKVRFRTFLQKLNLETFDTVDLDFGSKGYVASGSVKAVIEQANYNSEDQTIEFMCWTPVKAGTMVNYPFAWPSQIDPQWQFPTQEEQENGFAGGNSIGQGASGQLPIGFTNLEDWGDGVVWVGGPNVVFRGQADWGDPHPSDIGFTPQEVILPETYAELAVEANPNPDLSLVYVDPVKPPPLQEMPDGTFVIDLHDTRVIDSEEDHETSARLDSFFKRVNDDGELVVDTDNAKFGDEDHPDGERFDFKYDDDGEVFGAGTAFLKAE